MFHRWARPALGLVACLLFASPASGQATSQHSGGTRWRGVLRQNDPNPFSSQTTIPFAVGDSGCAPGAERHVVTLRIYNILSQVVAFATLVDSTSAVDDTSSVAPSHSISQLPLACGAYLARWDGKRSPEGREAPPGVYMYQLVIDGHPAGMRKMLLAR